MKRKKHPIRLRFWLIFMGWRSTYLEQVHEDYLPAWWTASFVVWRGCGWYVTTMLDGSRGELSTFIGVPNVCNGRDMVMFSGFDSSSRFSADWSWSEWCCVLWSSVPCEFLGNTNACGWLDSVVPVISCTGGCTHPDGPAVWSLPCVGTFDDAISIMIDNKS